MPDKSSWSMGRSEEISIITKCILIKSTLCHLLLANKLRINLQYSKCSVLPRITIQNGAESIKWHLKHNEHPQGCFFLGLQRSDAYIWRFWTSCMFLRVIYVPVSSEFHLPGKSIWLYYHNMSKNKSSSCLLQEFLFLL